MLIPKRLSKSDKSTEKSNVLQFDLKSDNEIRELARMGYNVAKKFKDVGLRFKKVIPASSDLSVRKTFRLPANSKLICLEIDISRKTEEEKMAAIQEIKNNFLLIDNLKLIDEKPYVYDKSNTVYRFLIKYELSSGK